MVRRTGARRRIAAAAVAVGLVALTAVGAVPMHAGAAAPATDPATTLVPACSDPTFPSSPSYNYTCTNFTVAGIGTVTASPAVISADLITGTPEFETFTFHPAAGFCDVRPSPGDGTNCDYVSSWSYNAATASVSTGITLAPLGLGDLSSGCVHTTVCTLRLHNGDSSGPALYKGLWLAQIMTVYQYVNGAAVRGYQLAAPFQIAGGAPAPPPAPTTATFRTAPDRGAPGAVDFDASGSRPATGASIANYNWDFGDSTPTVTTTTPTIVHPYTTGGLHTVTLTVTDSDGGIARYSVTVRTSTAAFGYQPDDRNPKLIDFDASASTATDGHAVATYTWNFGDGSTPFATHSPTTTHTFAFGGTKQVTLTVTDSGGQTSPPLTRTVLVAAYDVNSTGDAPAQDAAKPDCDTGATVSISGATRPECTLRAAIQAVNAAGRGDIGFVLPDAQTNISPATVLPPITAAGVTLDATTNPAGSIRLDGADVPNNSATGQGLIVSGAKDTIRGFRFFGWRTAVTVKSAKGGDIVSGNRIGITDDNGAPSDAVTTGVDIENSPGNTIGGTDTRDGNLISFVQLAVLVEGTGSTANHIEGNLLGTSADGTGYAGDEKGIGVLDASGTVIGGSSSVPGSGAGNVIVARSTGDSGGAKSTSGGVFVGGINATVTGTVIEGNVIGLLAGGTTLVSGSLRAAFSGGVIVGGRTSGTQIGGTAPGARNVIAGSADFDVEVTGTQTSGTSILGNRIGTNAAGTHSENYGGSVGVLIAGAHATTVGTPGSGGNLISGFVSHVGVYTQTQALPLHNGSTPLPGTSASATTTMSTVVSGNTIGPMANGSTVNASDVQRAGISLGGIGETAGPDNQIAWNAVGVSVGGARETVIGNLIGTDRTGLTSLPNGEGIDVTGSGAHIGLPAARRNTVSGNVVGITLGRPATVQNNLVGTTDLGDAAVTDRYPDLNALPDALVGNLGGLRQTYLLQVNPAAAGSVIGGTRPGFGNVLAGNPHGSGVILVGRSLLQGNDIGVGADGHTALGNAGYGIAVGTNGGSVIGAAPSTAGQTTVAGANVIADNRAAGIHEAAGSSPLTVLSNSIHGNRTAGIEFESSPRAAPGIVSVRQNGTGSTTVVLDTGGLPAGSIVQVFAASDCTTGTPGQGRTLLGDADTARGIATLTIPLQPAGALITATGTGTTGTSAFAACVPDEPGIAATAATVSPSTLAPGQDATATGSGFTSGEQVDAELHSDPIDLGHVRADDLGRVRITFNVPLGFPIGTHHVVFTGLSSGHVVSAAFTVRAPAAGNSQDHTLAATGEPLNADLVLTGLAMLTAGLALCVGANGNRKRDCIPHH